MAKEITEPELIQILQDARNRLREANEAAARCLERNDREGYRDADSDRDFYRRRVQIFENKLEQLRRGSAEIN